MDLTIDEARALVSNGTLWPKVRDYLAHGGEFTSFPPGVKSRLKLVDEETRAAIDSWVAALGKADEWKAVVDGEKVRELKKKYTFSFPSLNASLGTSGTFWIYSGICLIGLIFFLRRLPETKGKSLEQIEKEL